MDTGFPKRTCANARIQMQADASVNSGRMTMRKFLLFTTAAVAIASWEAKAQTDLSAYADANGFLDVQKLTCAQLAGTWQEDADMLMTWSRGWYKGLGQKGLFPTL